MRLTTKTLHSHRCWVFFVFDTPIHNEIRNFTRRKVVILVFILMSIFMFASCKSKEQSGTIVVGTVVARDVECGGILSRRIFITIELEDGTTREPTYNNTCSSYGVFVTSLVLGDVVEFRISNGRFSQFRLIS